VFRVSTSGDPGTWGSVTAPAVALRRGAGAGGSDRVTLTWPDNAIRNKWLQVTVLANARTGLAAPDVFYFGHLAGDASDTRSGAAAAVVDARDLAALRRHISRAPVNAGNLYDFNKDGVVSNADYAFMRRAIHTSLPMFTAPGIGAAFSDLPIMGSASSSRDVPRRRDSLLTDRAAGTELPV